MPQAIIMAGGQGERFWPITHKKFPKYRLRFEGKKSLLAKTYERLLRVYPKNHIHVVTTQPHLEFIRAEIPALKLQNILIEPFRNNTAAAIYFSCETIAKKFGQDEVVSFFPADHLIQNEKAFQKTLHSAISLAQKTTQLVTIGIKPAFPATGYGYIQAGAPISTASNAFKVARFVEKPNHRKALSYLKDARFLWNGGIFTWRAGVLIDSLKKVSPNFCANFDLKKLSASYKKLPNISIDYALLEKADNIVVQKTQMDWCDMGSWDMFFEKSKKDGSGNFSDGVVAHKDSRGSFFLNPSGVPLVVLGAQDLIVVQTSQGTLICKKSLSEEAALLFKKMAH